MRARVGLLALCLAGCARTQNIKEGETDYPRENPRPINVVHLSGTVDAPIRVKSVANWSAAGKGGESGGAAPLTTTAADGFLAGRCGWHFSGMTIEGRGISGFA
jgi:hypothetical protein